MTGTRTCPDRAERDEDSPTCGARGWYADCSVSGKTRTIRLHFAPANFAAMKAFQAGTAADTALPGTSSARTASPHSSLFGVLLRQQIPSESAEAAASEVQPDAAIQASADNKVASAFLTPPAGRGSGVHPKTSVIAEQEFESAAAESPHVQAGLRQAVRPVQRPDTATGLAAETGGAVETESAGMAESLTSVSISAISSAESGIAVPSPASVTNSGLQAVTLPAPALATPQEERAPAVGDEKRSEPAESPRDPEHRKSGPAGKPDGIKADPARSGATPANGLPEAGLSSTLTPYPLNAATPAPLPSHPASTPLHQEISPAGSQASRSQPSTPLQQPVSPSVQKTGNLPNRPLEGTGAPPLTGDPRAPMHRIQTGPAVAADLGKVEEHRPAGSPQQQPQHVPPLAGSAPAPGAAARAAQLLPVPASGNAAVPVHSSGGSAGPSLRPAATLERMDAAAPPRVLDSSPQNLAVGIRDAGLGWIEIRTHAIGGQVAATLASGSHEAHAAIAAELPAIRDTLMNQHVALHSLSAERFPASSGGGGSAADTSDSGRSARSSSARPKVNTPSAHSEAEGENLSYISVRV
jgi:hypothetical protein